MLPELDKVIAEIARAISAGSPPGLYEESLDLLRKMEDRLSSRRNLPNWLKRFLIVPFYLILRGIEQMAKSVGWFLTIVAIVSLIVSSIAALLPAESHGFVVQLAFWICGIVGVAIAFAAPSTFCSAGVNLKHVATIGDALSVSKRIKTPPQVDLVLKNMKVFEDRAKRRITLFQWVIGAFWAAFSPVVSTIIAAWTSNPSKPVELQSLLPYLALLATCYFAVDAYARGVDIVFRSIELGSNEFAAQLHKSSADEAKSRENSPKP